ncbi:TetR/AcrR family transcriptional regulator [Microbacterium sp. P04]|uniref:TetR/AcrR family transcriptional regulator n=1 Tax=Microbacterium sp. P04 TaxID=3366947 RepID=UPI003744E6BC
MLPPDQRRPSSLAKRERLLAAAEELFLAVGFDRVTMDAIAEAARVSKQTAYAHFGSKEGLFVELVTAITTDTGDRATAPEVSIPTDARAATILSDYLYRQLTAVMHPRVLRVRRLVIGEVPRFPSLARALWEHGPRLGIERIATILRELGDRGELAIDDVMAAASQLNWLVMGAPVNDAMLLGDEAIPDAEAMRVQVDAAVGTFLAAYAVTGPRGQRSPAALG